MLELALILGRTSSQSSAEASRGQPGSLQGVLFGTVERFPPTGLVDVTEVD
jgi:hypothetical protein